MTVKALKKIIYAEDEQDIREIAKIALEDIGGFTVYYCSDGLEVFEAIKIFTPDLFLLDVMMPGMDGPSVLRQLRTLPQFKHTPTLFMTAKIQIDEIEEYKSIGALDIISKPFDPITLAENIRELWNKNHGR